MSTMSATPSSPSRCAPRAARRASWWTPRATCGACRRSRRSMVTSSRAPTRTPKARFARRSSAAFPDHAMLGEEGGDREGAPGSPFRWIVDPIDGTMNFVHGFPYYAISIALTENGEITHGVVLDPLHDELFTAVRGKGAQLNGSPLRVSRVHTAGGRAGGHGVPDAQEPAVAALPAGACRADGTLRRHPPCGRVCARPRAPRGRAARRLLRDEPACMGRRGGRVDRQAKPAAAWATSPEATNSCAATR